MDDPLSAVELSDIERRIRHKRADEYVTMSAELIGRLYDMATRQTADENTVRLEQEADDLRMKLVTAEVACELMEKNLRAAGLSVDTP